MIDLPGPEDPVPPDDRSRHPFFMHDMIRGQELAVRVTLASVREDAASLPAFPTDRPWLFTGLGTSFHAAVGAALATGPLTGHRVCPVARPAFDIVTDPVGIGGVGGAFVFSSSGSTALTVRAQSILRERRIPTVLITGTAESPSSKLADRIVQTRHADERSWTHTVSYTTALCAAIAILDAWGRELRAESFELDAIVPAVEKAIRSETECLETAERLSDRSQVLLLGSRFAEPTAREAALKMREAAGRFTAAIGIEEFLHGPLPSVTDSTAVVAIANEPLERDRARQALHAASMVGAKTLLLDGTGAPPGTGELALPRVPPPLSMVSDIIPLQWITYWSSVAEGRNPDVMGLDDVRVLAARRTYGI